MSLTTPGLVCAHHHLYSALAPGMPAPPRAPRGFAEILELVWWRLDCALDAESIRWSALLGALDALEGGTTAIVDHHSSPNAIEGSLSVIADACAEVGIRVVCCYEVTDRNGTDRARAALDENERFIRDGGAGMVGAHACFTLSDETLDAVCALASDLDVGVHIHVAEDLVDADAGARLESRAQPTWVLAHAVHLDRPLAGTIVHNPRSNMVNGVGYARPQRWAAPVALGSDGIGADMLDEFRLAFARLREDDADAVPDTPWRWLWAGASLVPDVERDVVTWDHDLTPATAAYQTAIRPRRVEVDGEVVLDDGAPTRVDPVEIRTRAREEAEKLWQRL